MVHQICWAFIPIMRFALSIWIVIVCRYLLDDISHKTFVFIYVITYYFYLLPYDNNLCIKEVVV